MALLLAMPAIITNAGGSALPFTETFASFTSGDAITTSSNWVRTANQNGGQIKAQAGVAELDTTGGTFGWEHVNYDGEVMNANQIVTADIDFQGYGGGLQTTRLTVRCDSSFQNCYYYLISSDGSRGIYKRTGGSNALLDSGTFLGSSPTDTYSLEVSGTTTTTILAKRNGVTQATATDSSSPHTSGQAGFIILGEDSVAKPQFDNVVVDNL